MAKIKISFLIGIFAMTAQVFSQEKPQVIKKVNFGYSKNPPTRVQKDKKKDDSKKDSKEVKKTKKDSKEQAKKGSEKKVNEKDSKSSKNDPKDLVVASRDGSGDTSDSVNGELSQVTIAKKTREIAKKASEESLPLTDIYNVGVNDVLFISLQNNAAGTSRYYTVLKDGTIDYPLAGELVSVVGLTTDEIEDLLRSKVTLYENPEITVKVREHASHKITVLGLVEKSGERYLRREAMPLFVIRAESIVKSNATHVNLKRGGQDTETFDLDDIKTGELLVKTGDIIEFVESEKAQRAAMVNGFYYIGQLVRQFGRRDFYEGITLTQAILESGGIRNSKVKKVVIRRKNEEGLLKSEIYRLKDIKEGKVPDPILQAGDTIEAAD